MELSLFNQSATNLKSPLAYSLILHVILFGTLICLAVFSHQRETWGGLASEQGMKVIYLPKFNRYKSPPYLGKLSKVPKPTPPLKNASPYGNGIGGGPQIDTSIFLFEGRRGAGRTEVRLVGLVLQYPQYVVASLHRVSNNWLESTVGPSISFVPQVCIATFTILRDGTITNIQVTQSSGNQWADMSVVHAFESSNPLDHLPVKYTGSSVNLEFQFDFHPSQ